ncbi:MAG: EAL domain-containing protein [Planctomycetota bacterium]
MLKSSNNSNLAILQQASLANGSSLHPNEASDRGFRVLIADDEPVTRARLVRLLTRNGYHVKAVSDGLELLHEVKSWSPDLVLSDIHMPRLDGLATARLLRQIHDLFELPIIIMTTSEGREQILEAFEVGANDYIRKPIDNEITLARINNQLLVKDSQKKLRESEERYALATEGTKDGLWDWNLSNGDVYFSPRWRAMVGVNSDWQPRGREWMELIHPEDQHRVLTLLESHLCGEDEHFETELRIRGTTGKYRWMLCRGIAVRGDDGIASRIAGSLTDITEGKVADSLTGLPNRALFYDRVDACVSQLRKSPEQRFGLIYLDLDDFKLINDHLGHETGDEFLVEISRRMNHCLSGKVLVARLGGDEFAVLIENANCVNELIEIASEIDRAVRCPFRIHGREILPRASMGIVLATGSYNEDGSVEVNLSTEDLVRKADAAMYRAKKQNHVSFCVFEDHMLEESAIRLELGSEIRHAVSRHELYLAYQPIVDLQKKETIGFETLLRWRHPVHGEISPHKFIPIAESNGSIIDIGNWVLENSCKQLKKWNDAYRKSLMASINVSIQQVNSDEWDSELVNLLVSIDLDPSLIRLEITESMLMKDAEETIALLCKTRRTGIKIGLDDFGTGYSSLAYLHQIPMDILKIDRSFINQMNQSDKNLAIVKSIIALAKSLNLLIVAEGIETQEQLNQVRDLGVQMGQGYLFSKPLRAEKAESLIPTKWNF